MPNFLNPKFQHSVVTTATAAASFAYSWLPTFGITTALTAVAEGARRYMGQTLPEAITTPVASFVDNSISAVQGLYASAPIAAPNAILPTCAPCQIDASKAMDLVTTTGEKIFGIPMTSMEASTYLSNMTIPEGMRVADAMMTCDGPHIAFETAQAFEQRRLLEVARSVQPNTKWAVTFNNMVTNYTPEFVTNMTKIVSDVIPQAWVDTANKYMPGKDGLLYGLAGIEIFKNAMRFVKNRGRDVGALANIAVSSLMLPAVNDAIAENLSETEVAKRYGLTKENVQNYLNMVPVVFLVGKIGVNKLSSFFANRDKPKAPLSETEILTVATIVADVIKVANPAVAGELLNAGEGQPLTTELEQRIVAAQQALTDSTNASSSPAVVDTSAAVPPKPVLRGAALVQARRAEAAAAAAAAKQQQQLLATSAIKFVPTKA